MHALIANGVIESVEPIVPLLPDQGEWTEEWANSHGYWAVVETPQPDDTATHTHVLTYELIDGVPTQVWAPLAKPVELVNEETLQSRAVTSLTNNTDYLALDPPTPAQVATQVAALTRQTNGLIRLVLRRFDSTE